MQALARNQIITGDCLSILRSFPANTVDLVVTSPPYFQQRDYGQAGIGNEATEQEYLDNVLAVFAECLRVRLCGRERRCP